jgi:hypothetical protein
MLLYPVLIFSLPLFIPTSLTGLVLPFCTFLKKDQKNCILNVASTLSVICEN